MKKINFARISQILFLLLFLYLFVRTEYRGSDQIQVAVNSFFRGDPLVLACYVLAAKTFTIILLPALLVLLFTMMLGRFFCGWICPLGTVLDLVTARIRKTAPIRFLKGGIKYWLLFPLLFAALFNLNFAGIFDPIAIVVRALTFFLYPLFGDTVRSGWVGLYRIMGDSRDHLEPVYAIARDHLLPFRETFYPLAFASLLLFLFIIFLERYEKRNWCRNLCPLGTLLGLASRFSPFRRKPERICADCRECRDFCPTSFDSDIMQSEDCFRCMKCVLKCPRDRAGFGFKSYLSERRPFLPERRVLLGGMLSGFFLARLFRFREAEARTRLLRPPGVRSEDGFLKKCVRCGECMKVCLKNALYPAFLQAGIEGIYTPVIIPRLGYCEYNCTLCGQVCPTGAIPSLAKEVKKKEVIGKAVLDKNHCIPFARRTPCIVCEEHCPIPQKAIRSETVKMVGFDGRRVTLKLPYVVEELCNGCGICENVCPLEGKSAIEVFSVKDHTPIGEGAFINGDSDPYYPHG